MILNLMQFATAYLITNVIALFWRNNMNRGSYSINLFLFMRYVSQGLSVDNAKKHFPGSGSIVGTKSEIWFIRSLI